MSKRRALNLSLAAVGLLMLAAVGFVAMTHRQGGATAVQLEVAAHQQELVVALVAHADSLAAGTGRDEVLAARTALAHTVVSFDQGLGALLSGGAVALDGGHTRRVARVSEARAREELVQASHVWLATGMPLGDLAAGQYSPFSAAGQQALAGLHENHTQLAQHLQTAADDIRRGAAQRATLAGYATLAAGALGLAGLVLLAVRLLPQRKPKAARAVCAQAPADHARQAPDYADEAPRRNARTGRPAPYAPTIDFENVNAAVDQLSVDMNNIAGNTEKMRQAIESVGFALQGMLYSLNEMAQDTDEGHKIVRNANNAASFTADAATELVESAREMSRIVGRVTQLALRTRQVASQIEGEALHTGRTGEAFTSVVAQEVKGLAQQTNRATNEIDQTVNDVLATARQYEEAIGQIIKNVAAINKVSQNLGQLMLDPPRRVQAGAPAEPLAVAAAPAPFIAPAPPAPPVPVTTAVVEDDPVVPEPTPREVARSTSEAITAAAAQAAPVPTPAPAPAPTPAPAVTPPPLAATPAAPAPETTAPAAEAPKPDGGSSGNVFMLGKPRRKPTVEEVLGTAPAASAGPAVPAAPAAPAAPADVATPPPAAADELAPAPAPTGSGHASPQADGGSNGNVFLLNKTKGPKAAAPAPAPTEAPAPAAPAAAAPEPVAAGMAPAEATGVDESSGSNIFMLNRPKKKAPAEGAASAAPVAAEPAAAAPAPEPVPAGAPAEGGEAPKKNFIMLNSPKKPK